VSVDTPSATEWLTQKQAAEASGYTERTIRDYIARGILPAYRSRGGRGIRILRKDLDALFYRIPSATTGGE
jgi:excisionase family DNA binding protein